MVSDVWLPVRRLPASMNHALTQAEDGCWFGHLGAVLQADLPSPGTGWAKADAKGVHLKFSGRGRDVSCLTPPARIRRARLRIRLLPRMLGVEAQIGIRM